MKAVERPLNHKRLLEVLSYDQETGIFRWRTCQSRRNHIGDQAGYVRKDGYRDIQIDGLHYGAGRLAWFYHYGRWPDPQADHRDLNRDNNRISNLREATHSQNCANVGLLPTNRSGFKGASLMSGNRQKPWKAQIRKNQERFFLGSFATPREAHAAYRAAAARLHGYFSRPE
jgi:HNH endonuclease